MPAFESPRGHTLHDYALVEDTWVDSLVQELNKSGNRLFHRPVDPVTAEQFEREAARR